MDFLSYKESNVENSSKTAIIKEADDDFHGIEFPEEISRIESLNRESQLETLQRVIFVLNSSVSVSSIPNKYLISLLNFCFDTEIQFKISALNILLKVFELKHKEFKDIFEPSLLDKIFDAMNSTNEEITVLGTKALKAFIIEENKDILIDLNVNNLVDVVIGCILTTKERIRILESRNLIMNLLFDILTNFIKYTELNEEFPTSKTDSILCVIEEFITLPSVAIFIGTFSLNYSERSKEIFITWDFFDIIFSDIDTDDLNRCNALCYMADCFVTAYNESSLMLIKSEFFSAFVVTREDPDEHFCILLFRTLTHIIDAFNDFYTSVDKIDDAIIDTLESLSDSVRALFGIIRKNGYDGSYTLRVEATLLTCAIMNIRDAPTREFNVNTPPTVLSNFMSIDFEGIVESLIEMLDGKEKKLDIAIMHALRRAMFLSDHISNYLGRNKFFDCVDSEELNERIDTVLDTWEDDERVENAVKRLRDDIEKYIDFHDILSPGFSVDL